MAADIDVLIDLLRITNPTEVMFFADMAPTEGAIELVAILVGRRLANRTSTVGAATDTLLDRGFGGIDFDIHCCWHIPIVENARVVRFV